ncbi:MAG TPA: AI-2E family transporter [Patescibacteria group bacterium]|nr:AI-2E family transporter [Patescibacteria group bacterium]
MNVKIQIDIRTFVKFLLVIASFVGTIFVLWKLLSILLIIVISFFLAVALNTPVSMLARHLPKRSRVVATALSYIVIVTMLISFLLLVVPPVTRQIGTVMGSLPHAIDQISHNQSFSGRLVNQYHLKDIVDQFVIGIERQTGDIARALGANVLAGVSNVLAGFITIITVLVLTFMMLVEGPYWLAQLWSLYRNKALQLRHQQLLHKMYLVVTSYVNGQVLVAAIAGLMAGAMLVVLANFFKVPLQAVLPLSLVVFITALIPMIGLTLGSVIVTVALLFNDVSAGIIFGIYTLVYQQIENNVIQPAVQSRTVELSALAVLIAVIVGVVLIGPAGGFLAVPAAGCMRVLLLDYLEHRKHPKPGAAHGSQV